MSKKPAGKTAVAKTAHVAKAPAPARAKLQQEIVTLRKDIKHGTTKKHETAKAKSKHATAKKHSTTRGLSKKHGR